MKINWRRVLKTGLDVGKFFLPGAVSEAIDRVEEAVETMRAGGKAGWSGPEKQQAALSAVLDGVVIAEGLTKQDLLDNDAVTAAGRRAIDAAVAAKQTAAEFQSVIAAFKAARR